jgi:hypothetical protein
MRQIVAEESTKTGDNDEGVGQAASYPSVTHDLEKGPTLTAAGP